MITIYEVLGAYFHDRINAYEMARDNITQDDVIEHLAEFFDFHDLAAWCLNNPDFYKQFENEIYQAQDQAVEDLLVELVFEDDDEEALENVLNREFFDEEE